MTIRPATRQGVKPLIIDYSESGCGKTYSSLLMARGFVGPTGKMCLVDTEQGRGSLYADVPEIGGYDVLQIDPPFAPSVAIQAIDAVESAGYAIGILDSGSHFWDGIGGVLDIAGTAEEQGKKGLSVWKQPKLEHARFVLRLMQSKIPWIVCLRAKYKSRQVKNNGRTEIIKDDFTTPIQAEDFIFEATAHFEILHDHSIRLTKCSHPELRKCFPTQGPITIQTGEAIAKWCNAGTVSTKSDPLKACRAKLWDACKSFRGSDKSFDAIERQLVAWSILQPSERVADISTVERFQDVIDKVEIQLSEGMVA